MRFAVAYLVESVKYLEVVCVNGQVGEWVLEDLGRLMVFSSALRRRAVSYDDHWSKIGHNLDVFFACEQNI